MTASAAAVCRPVPGQESAWAPVPEQVPGPGPVRVLEPELGPAQARARAPERVPGLVRAGASRLPEGARIRHHHRRHRNLRVRLLTIRSRVRSTCRKFAFQYLPCFCLDATAVACGGIIRCVQVNSDVRKGDSGFANAPSD